MKPGQFYDPDSGLDGGTLPQPQQDVAPEEQEKPRESAERSTQTERHRSFDLDIPPSARTVKGLRDRRRVVE